MSEALFCEEWHRADKHISEETFVVRLEVGVGVSGDVIPFKNLFIDN
jgi:hypothetical protein